VRTLGLLGVAFLIGGARSYADPLKSAALTGFCAAPTACTADGISTLVHSSSPTFGFSFNSPKKGVKSAVGDDLLVFLLPDNEDPNPSAISFEVHSTNAGTNDSTTVTKAVSLDSSKPWHYGYLGVFLGNYGQPNQAYSLYEAGSKGKNPDVTNIDPGETGYYVYTVDLGWTTITGNGPTFTLEDFIGINGLPKGTFIVDFLHTFNAKGVNDGSIATTNTSALLTDVAPSATVPEPAAVFLLGAAILSLVRLSRNRLAG